MKLLVDSCHGIGVLLRNCGRYSIIQHLAFLSEIEALVFLQRGFKEEGAKSCSKVRFLSGLVWDLWSIFLSVSSQQFWVIFGGWSMVRGLSF